MAWPGPVYPGNPILASQFNGLLTAFSTWADSVTNVLAVAGASATFSAPVTFGAGATFSVAPTFTDAAGTRTALGLPALNTIPTLAGSNLFSSAGAIIQSITASGAGGTVNAGIQLNNDLGAWCSLRNYSSTASTALGGITLTNWSVLYCNSGAGFLIETANAAPIVFGTNNLERARFVSAGRFLIGTTTDDGSNVLQVTGGVSLTGTLLLNGGVNLNGQTLSGNTTGSLTIGRAATYASAAVLWAINVGYSLGGDNVSLGQSSATYSGGLIQWIGSSNAFLYFNSGQDLRIGSGIGGTPIMCFKGSNAVGRVLLGTTTDNGTDLLQVAGTSYFNASATFTASAAVTFNGSVAMNAPTTFGGGAITMTRPAAYLNNGASWALNIQTSLASDNVSLGQTGANYSTGGAVTWAGNSNAFLYFNSGQDLRVGSGSGATPIMTFKGAGRVLLGTLTDDGSNLLQVNGGVNFKDATNLTFGSNWQSWTPTVTGSGSMTISGLTITDAQYIRIGPLVYFKLYFSFTMGGTVGAGDAFSATLPIAVVGNVSTAAMQLHSPTTNWQPGYALINNTNSTIRFALFNEANMGTGAWIALCEGFYRVA